MKTIIKVICLLFLIPYSLFLTSCSQGNKYPRESRALDSLNTLIQWADSSIKTLDTMKLKNYDEHIMQDLAFLRANKIDSMTTAAADIFRNYNNIHWSLSALRLRKNPLLTELEKSNAQLNHLSHDMKEGLIKDDSAKIYADFELKKAGELIEVTKKSLNDYRMQVPMYGMISPQADSLIALVKEHKKI